MSPKPSRPRLADQIAARRDELRLLALPDINAGPAAAIAGVQEAPVSAIVPNPDQPRREFSPVRLATGRWCCASAVSASPPGAAATGSAARWNSPATTRA